MSPSKHCHWDGNISEAAKHWHSIMLSCRSGLVACHMFCCSLVLMWTLGLVWHRSTAILPTPGRHRISPRFAHRALTHDMGILRKKSSLDNLGLLISHYNNNIIIIGYIFATIISKTSQTRLGHISRWYRHKNDHNITWVCQFADSYYLIQMLWKHCYYNLPMIH